MLIPVSELVTRFGVHPEKVLHVGGHLGEEQAEMSAFGWGSSGVFWVESQEALCSEMRIKFSGTNNFVVQATVWSESGLKMTFNDNINSQSSSLYDLGTHKDSYPDFVVVSQREVVTTTLDSLSEIPSGIDFVNLDVQGAELEALKGAQRILKDVSWIYTEVNRKHVYESCPLISDIDKFLKSQGFRRVATRWSFGEDWGDALYAREYKLINSLIFKILNTRTEIKLKMKYKLHDLRNMRIIGVNR